MFVFVYFFVAIEDFGILNPVESSLNWKNAAYFQQDFESFVSDTCMSVSI